MSELPFFYNRVSPTTWVHLSSLLTIAIFFKFSRLWSVRNLDLIALILVAPGLLFAQVHSVSAEQIGYLWLFAATLWFLIRTLLDPMMVRRPLLEPNLSVGGLTFLGIALYVFLMANVLTGTPAPQDRPTPSVAMTEQAPSADGQAPVGDSAQNVETQAPSATADAIAPAANTASENPSSTVSAELADVAPPHSSESPAAEPRSSSGSAASKSQSAALPPADHPAGAQTAGPHAAQPPTEEERIARQGPGYPPLFQASNFITQRMILRDDEVKSSSAEDQQALPPLHADLLPTRIALVLLHLSVVIGLALIGYRHFDNVKTGIAAAVLYLMIPYTAEFTGCLRHILPAAPLVWAIVCYRRPVLSGLFMGLACGLSYYPLFLLPLWLSFYWQRGLLRFCGGLLPALAVLVGLLAVWAPGREAFFTDVRQMFGWIIPQMQRVNFEGCWGQPLALLDPVYRMPILAAFVALSATMTIWPAQKNLGSLISCSAALMLATQFWDAHRGGLFLGWYLPLLLLTIFRPNLEDRVALSVLGEGWFPKRRSGVNRVGQAA
jgi:hypothetical protein